MIFIRLRSDYRQLTACIFDMWRDGRLNLSNFKKMEMQHGPPTISMMTDPGPTQEESMDLNPNDQLNLLKPPQLNNIQDLGDTVWISSKDGKPYVKIFLKTKNEYCRAEFSDLSARKQRDLIERLAGIDQPGAKDLVSILERFRRPVPASDRSIQQRSGLSFAPLKRSPPDEDHVRAF